MRIVVDTNVLIDGFQDDFSAQARLIDAVRKEQVTALITPAIMREYRTIMRRLINDPVYRERVNDFLSRMEKVEPAELNIVIDDADDEKFVRAAVGGQADMVVTNDRHLLDVGEMDGVHIVTPKEAWRHYEEEEGSSHEWESFVKGLGIGR